MGLVLALWLGQGVAALPAAGNAGNDDPTEKAALIEQVMSLSGMDEMIVRLPDMARTGFQQQPPPPVDRAQYEQFQEIFLTALDPGQVRRSVVNFLDRHFDGPRFADFAAMLNTPVAKQMTALELQAGTPEAGREMMAFANTTLGQLSAERAELIRRLERAQGAAEAMVAMQVMMARTMMEGMNRIVPQNRRLKPGQIETFFARMRQDSLAPARQYAELNMAYAYRSVSDSTLADYAALYESETGRWATALLVDAWLDAYRGIARRLAQAMAESFGPHDDGRYY
ncbi:MAG TPA: hypothetical protein ENJ19_02825 [Gammaproteobacteria bacterium]|nr:hypothetical protein [Gammaproteobacteria bacterium]